MESACSQPGRCCRPTPGRSEARRRSHLGRRHASEVPRSITRVERSSPRAVGPLGHDRYATRRSARRAMERCRPRRRPAARRADDHAGREQGHHRRTEDRKGAPIDIPRRRDGRCPQSTPQAHAGRAAARRPRLQRRKLRLPLPRRIIPSTRCRQRSVPSPSQAPWSPPPYAPRPPPHVGDTRS